MNKKLEKQIAKELDAMKPMEIAYWQKLKDETNDPQAVIALAILHNKEPEQEEIDALRTIYKRDQARPNDTFPQLAFQILDDLELAIKQVKEIKAAHNL